MNAVRPTRSSNDSERLTRLSPRCEPHTAQPFHREDVFQRASHASSRRSCQTLGLAKTMSAGIFALLLVLVPLGLAGFPALFALRGRTLFAADIGLVFLPAPAFLAALVALNEPAQTGWAGIAYPFFVFWVCIVAFYARVFALPHLGLNPRPAAIGTLVLALLAAVLFGAFVPPLEFL